MCWRFCGIRSAVCRITGNSGAEAPRRLKSARRTPNAYRITGRTAPSRSRLGNRWIGNEVRFGTVTGEFRGRRCSRRAHYSTAGMRAGSAEIEAGDGRAVTGPSGYGAQEEHLVEAHLAVEDVAAGDAETAFEIEGLEHLALAHDRVNVGCVFGDDFENAIAVGLAQVIPGGVPQACRARTAGRCP